MNDFDQAAEGPDSQSIRGRFQRALDGDVVERPVYAVYDWFVQNRPIDWQSLFQQGLGQIAHADLVRVERPNVEVIETTREVDGRVRRDVRWITDRGELRESHLGEWQQEHLIKTPEDYRIMRRALEGTRYTAVSEPFLQSEAQLGDGGITVGQLGWAPIRRTPLLQVQIDFTGPERLALDLADELPELMELLELMTELTLRKLREAVKGPGRYIKLWENLAIETLGTRHYRRRMVPFYRQMLEILEGAGKRLLVHYDGKLRPVADEIAALAIDGIDSLTPPPDGDMSVAEARARWPEKFLWLHPPLGWYREGPAALSERIRAMTRDAGPRRYCLMISEDVPPDWETTVPAVLEALETS